MPAHMMFWVNQKKASSPGRQILQASPVSETRQGNETRQPGLQADMTPCLSPTRAPHWVPLCSVKPLHLCFAALLPAGKREQQAWVLRLFNHKPARGTMLSSVT